MSSSVGKQEAARLPLGTRWQVKWHLERRQRKKQSLEHPASGAGVRDEIVVDTGKKGIIAESSSALTVVSHFKSGIFPKRRCRTWRRSSKLHAEKAAVRLADNPPGNRGPSLLRLGIPVTALGAKFTLRLAGLAGLRVILSGTCWPLLKMVCLSGFAKNPLTRVARFVMPGCRSRITKSHSTDSSTPFNDTCLPARGPLGVALGAGMTTLAVLQSLGPPLLCAQALLLVLSVQSRLSSSEPGEVSMHVGTLGPDYSQYIPPPHTTGQPHAGSFTPPVCQDDSRTCEDGWSTKTDVKRWERPHDPSHSQTSGSQQHLPTYGRSSAASPGHANEVAVPFLPTPPTPPTPPISSKATAFHPSAPDATESLLNASERPPAGPLLVTSGTPYHEGHIAYAPIVLDRRLRRHERGQRLLSLPELHSPPWSDLVFWHGNDREGRRLLCVQLGLAVKVVEKGRMDSLADVIITHIETAETTWLAQPSARCPEISVVIDAEGLGLLRRPPLECLQRIGSVLNRDYPGRGGYVYIINPPGVLGVVLAQLRRLLVPRQTAEVSHARHGFLPGHQHVLLVSKRQKAVMVDHFDPHMLPEPLYGACDCMRTADTSCQARQPF